MTLSDLALSIIQKILDLQKGSFKMTDKNSKYIYYTKKDTDADKMARYMHKLKAASRENF